MDDQVQGRIQKNTPLVTQFDAQLKEMGSQFGRFGRQELSSEFLGESLHYLLTVYRPISVYTLYFSVRSAVLYTVSDLLPDSAGKPITPCRCKSVDTEQVRH